MNNSLLKKYIINQPGFNDQVRNWAEKRAFQYPEDYQNWVNSGKPEDLNDPYWGKMVDSMANILAISYVKDGTWKRNINHFEAKQPDCQFDMNGVCTICGGFKLYN